MKGVCSMKVFSIPILLLTFLLVMHFLGTTTKLMSNCIKIMEASEARTEAPITEKANATQDTPITVVAPPWLPIFLEKMNKEIFEKAKQHGFPVPKIEFELNPTLILVDPITGVIQGYILGFYTYETKIITIFGWGPDYGAWFSEEELRYTILHEILHHWDDWAGKPKCGPIHNAEFDKRLKELGWVKPDYKSFMIEKAK